jgi:hypothetical protein
MWIIKVVLINWIGDLFAEHSIQVILNQQRAQMQKKKKRITKWQESFHNQGL